MATADQYAEWIVKNADKKGTDEFNTVVEAYKQAKAEEAAPVAKPAPEKTFMEQAGDIALPAAAGTLSFLNSALGGLPEAMAPSAIVSKYLKEPSPWEQIRSAPETQTAAQIGDIAGLLAPFAFGSKLGYDAGGKIIKSIAGRDAEKIAATETEKIANNPNSKLFSLVEQGDKLKDFIATQQKVVDKIIAENPGRTLTQRAVEKLKPFQEQLKKAQDELKSVEKAMDAEKEKFKANLLKINAQKVDELARNTLSKVGRASLGALTGQAAVGATESNKATTQQFPISTPFQSGAQRTAEAIQGVIGDIPGLGIVSKQLLNVVPGVAALIGGLKD